MFGYTDEEMHEAFKWNDERCDMELTLKLRAHPNIQSKSYNDNHIWVYGTTTINELREEYSNRSWAEMSRFLDQIKPEELVMKYQTHQGSVTTDGFIVLRGEEIMYVQRSCMFA
jgi:hypothetical protein